MKLIHRCAVGRRRDDGMVTAEAAVVIPSLFVVLALMLAVLMTVGAHLSVVDASREAARRAARGDSTSAAVEAAKRLAPRGATVTIHSRGDVVEAEVRATVRPFRLLPSFTVRAAASAEQEGR